jgi:sensor histidine kinase YesM
MVLHNSEKNFVSLNQEIEMCRLYLELESLRFKHSFHYTIDIDKRIDADAILFPCLLLQPLIENAIWHGLLPKEGSKLLNIRFAEENGFLICAITDNGVGREKAAAIKSGKMDIHHSPSKGISLVKQRLAVIETGTSSSATLDIEDHKDPEGTTVNIRLSIPQP